MSRHSGPPGRRVTFGAVLLLVVLNPVLYSFHSSLRYFPPDSIKYLELARGLSTSLALRVEGFGHVDAVSILPPLYPALIALGSAATEHLLAWAEYVSSLSLLAAALPLYLLVSSASSVPIALAVVALAQVHGNYHETAFWPLTEALFIFITATATLAVQRMGTTPPRPRVSLALGILVAVVFLTRQIGLVFLAVPLASAGYSILATRGNNTHRWVAHGALLIAGFLAVAGTYSIELYRQTHSHPLTQNARLGRYVIPAAPEDLDRIEAIRGRANPRRQYDVEYARRRALRELNGDASEMLGNLRIGDGATKRAPPYLRIFRIVGPLRSNLAHLRSLLGPVAFWLFLLSMLVPVHRCRARGTPLQLSPVWSWIVFYLVGLSLFASLVERYLVVLVPFAFAQIGIALHTASGLLGDGTRSTLRERSRFAIVLGTLALSATTVPRLFSAVDRHPKFWEDVPSLEPVRRLMRPGEPVFSIQPMEAYFVGGTWRTLPNDSIARVAAYGRRTGVRWLLVSRIPSVAGEATLYDRASWYRDPGLLARTGLPVVHRASSTDGLISLFEIER